MSASTSLRHGLIITLAVAVCGSMITAVTIATAEAAEDDRVTQTSIVSVITDKTEYVYGDAIVIYGDITTSIIDTPIILQIFRDNNPVYINQIMPGKDNAYWDIVRGEGTKWEESGEYVVNIRYGKDEKAIAKFNFITKEDMERQDSNDVVGVVTTTSGSAEVEAGNETFDVEYTVSGGTVTDMRLDWRDFTLVVDINATGKAGTITMEMPRKYIGAERTNEGSGVTDEVFIVLVDGVETSYDEPISLPTTRTITVEFTGDAPEIRVIGTYAVPEFSHAMALLLLLLACGMLAITILSRTKRAVRRYGPVTVS